AADSTNPRIASALRTAEAAQERVPQAGALPDPMVGVGLMNVPVTRPGLGNDMMTMLHLRVGAVLPWPGKLGLREDVARLEAEAAAWEIERVRQDVRAEVESAYYQIYFVDRALEVTGRNEALVSDFARLTSSKYGVGTATQPDVLRAQVERTSLSDQLVALHEQRVSAAARLNALLARPTDTPVTTVELPEVVRVAALSEEPGGARFASAALADVLPGASPGGGLPSVAEIQRLALEHSPMIQAHVRRVEAQGRALALSQKSKLPDLNITAGYSRRAGFGDFFDVMVSAPVPIFSGRKQNQGVFEHAAMLAEHEARHDAMVDELNGEIASLAAEAARARDQLVLLNDGILPQARTGLASATASYQVGRVDFLTLLDAQVTLYRHELNYHRLLADFAANLAALERAVGTEVLR
ncbi:MAG TPA: TolC family protein, partial [Longimicrobiales bacterium]|nr:TolC family protein [Longimicrobiales bacterium]